MCAGWLCRGGCRAEVAQTPVTGRPTAGTVEALFVSDIHFEPFWDPAKALQLAAAPVTEWNTILAAPDTAGRKARFAELEKACPTRGEDTHYALYASSLQAMRRDAGDAKFVIVSGDLMAHSFSCKFAALFQNAAPGEYRAFVEKTIEFVVNSLREALPGVPVYAALGNNDSDCGDYQLDANSEFLGSLAGEFTHGFGRADGTRRQGRLRGRVLQRAIAGAYGAHATAGAGRSVHVAAV